MQTSDRNIETRHGLPAERTDSGTRLALASHWVSWRLVLSILGSGLLVIAGPTTLRMIAHVSLISIQIVLELGRLGLAAFQIFGK